MCQTGNTNAVIKTLQTPASLTISASARISPQNVSYSVLQSSFEILSQPRSYSRGSRCDNVRLLNEVMSNINEWNVEGPPMPLTIFHTENNSAEEWLRLNDDGTVSHHIENSGWSMTRSGTLPREKQLTAQEAKVRWPSYAEKIDRWLLDLAGES